MKVLVSSSSHKIQQTTEASSVSKKVRAQSGVIPFRIHKDRVQVLLVTTTLGGSWGIPKGGIEPDMTKRESAENEALEEAGILGKAKKKIGTYRYIKGRTGKKQVVVVYAFRVKKVKKRWLEDHRRSRKWFDIEDAERILPYLFLPMLDKVRKIATR